MEQIPLEQKQVFSLVFSLQSVDSAAEFELAVDSAGNSSPLRIYSFFSPQTHKITISQAVAVAALPSLQ